MSLRDDQIYDYAERIYFNVIAQLGIESECIEPDPDNEGGTRNTEKGRDLYFTIEETLQEGQ